MSGDQIIKKSLPHLYRYGTFTPPQVTEFNVRVAGDNVSDRTFFGRDGSYEVYTTEYNVMYYKHYDRDGYLHWKLGSITKIARR